MTSGRTLLDFSVDRVVEVARAAARAAGLDGSDPELIRIGENAILRLPGAVILRIGRGPQSFDLARREITVARALERAGANVVRAFPDVEQPLLLDEYPVTFWQEVAGPLQEPTVAELGAALRRLHGAVVDVELPRLDPWDRTADRIEKVPISDDERDVLRQAYRTCADQWPSFVSELGEGLIHGDAHLGNLVKGSNGSVVLVDLDSICIGPREWDLAPTGLSTKVLHWITSDDYAGFVRNYGYDITESASFELLARMREVRMTAWIAQLAKESDRLAREVSHRIACLADPEMPRHWTVR